MRLPTEAASLMYDHVHNGPYGVRFPIKAFPHRTNVCTSALPFASFCRGHVAADSDSDNAEATGCPNQRGVFRRSQKFGHPI
jgi:hypothetical protein